MDSFDFNDRVKSEKANALARDKQLFITIAKMLQLIEVLVAVALITWLSSRFFSVFKLSGENLLIFSSNFLNHNVAFLVGNVIIVLCYVLSGHSEAGNYSEICNEKCSMLSQQETTEDKSNGESVTPPVKETQLTEETAGEECKNLEGHYECAIVKTESEMAVEMTIKQAAKKLEKFRRTQSGKLKREISIKTQQELQRSAAAAAAARRSGMFATSIAGSSTAISFETVEKLSNEDFRLAVEAFILKQQSILKQQGMVENRIEM